MLVTTPKEVESSMARATPVRRRSVMRLGCAAALLSAMCAAVHVLWWATGGVGESRAGWVMMALAVMSATCVRPLWQRPARRSFIMPLLCSATLLLIHHATMDHSMGESMGESSETLLRSISLDPSATTQQLWLMKTASSVALAEVLVCVAALVLASRRSKVGLR